jgi:hypothetical protein
MKGAALLQRWQMRSSMATRRESRYRPKRAAPKWELHPMSVAIERYLVMSFVLAACNSLR